MPQRWRHKRPQATKSLTVEECSYRGNKMRQLVIPVIAGLLLLSACGAEPAATGTQLSALAQRGERVFSQCAACHSIEAGQPHRSGPNLHGIMGAPIGSRDGYNYSPALRGADGVWTEERLGAWLENPQGEFDGHKMMYGGLASAEDRRAVIAYLTEAGGPVEGVPASDTAQ